MVPVFIGYTAGSERVKLSRGMVLQEDVTSVVDEIINGVRQRGDVALFEYTEKFDKFAVKASNIKVTNREIRDAYAQTDPRFEQVILRAKQRIEDFHMKQKRNSWMDTSDNGEILGQLLRPIENVGVYVPGGKAAYPSSVLMNVIPAKVAGVKNIIMATPADGKGNIPASALVAADTAGVDAIYKIGGAQAVAAMAFGTASIPKVDKIVGPGNIYVASAKRAVFGHTGIDMFAGPSEILIIADKTANPKFVAADMLSQAEHDELASSILVTTSEKLAENVNKELAAQTERLDRRKVIEASLKNNGAIIIVKTLEEAVGISNEAAPEHLELLVLEPFSLLPLINNAGAVFMGNYSPEPLGDYMAGPNHVLPTSGSARFFSPLSVDDFIKKTSLISFGRNALSALKDDIAYFAETEGLSAHANAVNIRFG